MTLNSIDKAVIRALQGDFPLVAEPYKALAESVGLSQEEFLARVQRLAADKKIRKMGAVLRHREVGYGANALCAWIVPKERLDEVAANMSANMAVSHCYDRTTTDNWHYNLYTMIHAKSRDECEQIAEKLANDNNVHEKIMLYSKKEWKKTSMKYFCEDNLDDKPKNA